MRKIAMFLVCIMLVTSCLLVFPIKNVKAGFGVSPPSISEYHLLPGSHYETIIYLVQSDPTNLTYCQVILDESEIQDWITIDPGFYFPFWVSLFPMGVIIDVPENATLGNYSSTILARKIVTNQEGQVVIVLGVQVTISLTVIDYNYTYYEVVGADTPSHHIGEPMSVSLTIVNQGNTYTCPPYVIVDIYDQANINLLETINLTNWTPVAPFTRTAITKQCQINQTCGGYFSHINIPDKANFLIHMQIVPFPFLSNPIPQNGSTMVPPINTVLSWSCEGILLTYDVYFGTVNPPPQIISNQSENSFIPVLNYSTTYYWKINAWDYLRGNCIGPLWSFTTAPPNEPPYPPSNPYPPNNAPDIPLTTILSWNGSDPNGWDTVTYDVYFGTSSSPPLQVNNQSGTTYNLGTLSYLTTYYWNIVAWDNHGASTVGAIWSFTTKANSLPIYGTPSPYNGSTGNPLQITWSIPINDAEGDQFTWTIQCSNEQTNGSTGATNGTKTLVLTGLEYSTTYTVWVNSTDPTGSGLYTRRWYTFITKPNIPPVFGTTTPTNESTNQPLSLTWSIPINDPEGDQFSWTIQCNNGQTISGNSASNGTKSLALSALYYSTTYKVWVNATDPGGSGLYTRKWYTFTTKTNLPPIFGTPTPNNGSTSQPLSLSWSIPINDPDGDTFSWTIQCSNGQVNSGTGATNGTKSLSISGLAYLTNYKVWVNATDPTGSGLYTRKWYTFSTKSSQPPVFGSPNPANSSTNNPLSLTWSIPINDPEGDQFSWTIQCSNGQTTSGSAVSNGTKSLALSGLAYSTTYKVWVNATDPTGSGLYTRKWYTFTTQQNTPPNKPNIPSGETNGEINTPYTYSTSTTDPNGNQIFYMWDWGDGSQSSWLGPYNSGVTINVTHTWTTKGSYSIKVKAKDTSDAESLWSDSLPITMPLDLISGDTLLSKQVNQSPNAFPLLRQLLTR